MKQLNIHIDVIRNGFSLHVNEQFPVGITGVFGHSGAGKSTLLQCISGVNAPTNGRISIGSTHLFCARSKINKPINKRKVGYVFQEGRLFPHLNIEKNLKYGWKASRSKIRFDTIVSMLSIGHVLQHYPSDISGGERQRVALGRALLTEPDILLLDEPFSALDQKMRQQIIPFIVNSASLLSIPVLIVSHDLPDLLKLTQRLCIIKNGRVIGHDSYEQLISNNSLQSVLPVSDIINSIKLEVKHVHPDARMVTLNGFGANRRIHVLMESASSHYTIGNETRVFIRPKDIILAESAVENTSFQNQLQGSITKIINEGSKVMCQVDCGFPLLCEVSNASYQQMQLKPGKKVYCLFKTLAIDRIGV